MSTSAFENRGFEITDMFGCAQISNTRVFGHFASNLPQALTHAVWTLEMFGMDIRITTTVNVGV